MQLKPDELPPMVEGERRLIQLRLAGAVGPNSIVGLPELTGSGLTFGTPTVNGTNVDVLVTASSPGTYYMLVAATLSSNEIVKGNIRVDVKSDSPSTSNGDYR